MSDSNHADSSANFDQQEYFVSAQLFGIKTLVDGGVRLTIDLGQDSSSVIQRLMTMKMSGQEHLKVCFVNAEEV